MPPGKGHECYLQTGPKEPSYGTYVAPTQKLELLPGWDLPLDPSVIPDPSLYGGVSPRALFAGPTIYKGSFAVRLNYEGLLELFRGVLPSYTSALVETGVRDHTFKEGPLLNSYSPELFVNVPAGKCFRILGQKHPNLTIRGTAGTGDDAMLRAEFGMIVKSVVSNQTPTGSLVFPTYVPAIYHSNDLPGAVVDDGTGDAASSVRVRSFELAYEQPHTAEERVYLGSKTIDEPLRMGLTKCTWKLTQEFTTLTQFEAAKNFTEGSPRLVFQDPTVIGGGSKREFEIRSNKANLVGFSIPIESYGIIISTATWEAFNDAGDASSLVARFRNTEAALP
jgi:hypothetical protein